MSAAPSTPYLLEQQGHVWAWTVVEIARREDADSYPGEQSIVEARTYLERLLDDPDAAVVGLRWIRPAGEQCRLWAMARVTGASRPEALRLSRTVQARLTDVPRHLAIDHAPDTYDVLAPFDPAPGGLVNVVQPMRSHPAQRRDNGPDRNVAVMPFGPPVSGPTLTEVITRAPGDLAVTVIAARHTMPEALTRFLQQEAARLDWLARPTSALLETGGHEHVPGDPGAGDLAPVYRSALHVLSGRVWRFAITVTSPQPLSPSTATTIANTVGQPHAILWPGSPEEQAGSVNAFKALEPVTPTEHWPRQRAGTGPAIAAWRQLADRTEITRFFSLAGLTDPRPAGLRRVSRVGPAPAPNRPSPRTTTPRVQRYRALLIGNADFPGDPDRLAALKGPRNDVDALANALTDSAHGLFGPQDVGIVKDANSGEIMVALEQFFKPATKDEVLLVYYSGHGWLSETKNLLLCASNTRVDVIAATTVSTTSVADLMRVPATVVVLLDCCYAGDANLSNVSQLAGHGRFVVMATRHREPAWDAVEATGTSHFTTHVVGGLRGGAVRPGSEHVSLSDLYEYIHRRMTAEGGSVPQRTFHGEDVNMARVPTRPA